MSVSGSHAKETSALARNDPLRSAQHKGSFLLSAEGKKGNNAARVAESPEEHREDRECLTRIETCRTERLRKQVGEATGNSRHTLDEAPGNCPVGGIAEGGGRSRAMTMKGFSAIPIGCNQPMPVAVIQGWRRRTHHTQTEDICQSCVLPGSSGPAGNPGEAAGCV